MLEYLNEWRDKDIANDLAALVNILDNVSDERLQKTAYSFLSEGCTKSWEGWKFRFEVNIVFFLDHNDNYFKRNSILYLVL